MYHDKHKGGAGKKRNENGDEDDEITMQHSDDEESENLVENPLIEVLRENMAKFA